MRWSVTIPGQPLSLDKAYRTGYMTVTRKGRPVLDESGQPKKIHRPILTDAARFWKRDVTLLARNAKPSRWHPTGQVRVYLHLYLAREIDADNILKLCLDGLADGIGVNDRIFLPCIRHKEIGCKDPRVELTIDDEISLE